MLGPGPAAMALMEDIGAAAVVGAPAALAPPPFMRLLLEPLGMLRLVALACWWWWLLILLWRCSARFAPPGIRLSLCVGGCECEPTKVVLVVVDGIDEGGDGDSSDRFRFEVEFELECECRLVVELELECGGVWVYEEEVL